MKKTTILFLSLLFTSFTFFAGTLYVETAANGGNDSNAGTAASPKLTLSGAISAASAGDIIIIGPGTFTDHTLNVNKALTIQGHGREDTTFDGTGLGSVGFMSITAASVTVKNMTIQDYAITSGDTEEYGGTAIRVGAAQGSSSTDTGLTSITIKNIKFYNNTNTSTLPFAGAVEIVRNTSGTNHDVDIEECLFYDNTSSGRAAALGIYDGSTVDLRNCVMVDNTATTWGGAIYQGDLDATSGDSTLNVYNCTIYRNRANQDSSTNSGGIRSYSANDQLNVNVYNSIVSYNIGNSGGAAYWWDIHTSTGSTVTYNINYTYTNYMSDGYFDTSPDSWDSFTDTNEYGEGWYGGSWPGFSGADKKMWLDATGDHAVGKVVANGTSIDVNGVTRPQGTAIDIGAYEYRNTWDGSESTAWATADNWSLATVPSATAAYNAPYITNQTNDPVISTDIIIDNLLIENPGVLTIQKTGSLKLTEHLIQNGTLTMESDNDEYSALIVQGNSYGEDVHESDGTISSTHSGNITYERHVADEGSNEWDYIGSPVASQDLQTLIDNNSSLATNGSQVAIGAFDNSAGDTAALMYTNYSTTGNSGTTITSGQGFAMATDEGSTTATVDFTGTINTSDVTFAIDDESSSNTNNGKFNLVSNPFPTYIAFNAAAVSASGATEAFLTINATTNDNLHNSYAGLWGYDGDGTFTEKNATSAGAIYIAPGQGFFVAADASTNLSFNEAMQTVTGGDDFIDNSDVLDDSYEVLLRLYHGDQVIEDARLFFMEELTLGLDIAYDMGDFNYNAALMTRLVEEDEGYGMAINAMSTEDMDDVVIPLEINQTAGQEFKINLHTSTIGEINIYLEDTELSTLTLLNEEDFVMTPTSDLSDAGRFYIHLTADTLSNEAVNTSLLNAYKGVDNNYITIEGLATQPSSTQVSLFNILGTRVMDISLDNTTNTQTVSTNGLSTGIYVLKLVSGQDQLTKKLIIK